VRDFDKQLWGISMSGINRPNPDTDAAAPAVEMSQGVTHRTGEERHHPPDGRQECPDGRARPAGYHACLDRGCDQAADLGGGRE